MNEKEITLTAAETEIALAKLDILQGPVERLQAAVKAAADENVLAGACYRADAADTLTELASHVENVIRLKAR